jgi:hypothetical protein
MGIMLERIVKMLLDSSNSVPVANSFERCNDPLGSVKGNDILVNSMTSGCWRTLPHGINSIRRCTVITPYVQVSSYFLHSFLISVDILLLIGFRVGMYE